MRSAGIWLALCSCAALACPAVAADGLWSTDFWGLRKCGVSGKLQYDGQYFAFGFSWTDSKQSVEFFVTEMSGAAGGKEQLSIESPSLEKPWFPIVGLTDYQSGPQVEALRKDIARGATWRLSVKPKRGKPRVLDAPPSNGRTQLAMFDACVATSAKFPNIENESTSQPWHWSVKGEASACEAYAKYGFANTTLELFMEARRGETNVFARIIDPAVAGVSTIDLKAIGGPRFSPGGRQTLSLAGPASAELLAKLWVTETAAVTVVDAAGQSTSIPLVSPQDVVDFAMFRACVAALEPPGP
jgi:hypothetical protein